MKKISIMFSITNLSNFRVYLNLMAFKGGRKSFDNFVAFD